MIEVKNMKGIVLAAGYGKRLGSITQILPKPLLPINGKPIIELIIEKLKTAGIEEIGINLYYKADLIKSALKDIPGLYLVVERYLSGTGGALLNFRDFVSDDFLLHNCDVLSNVDLKKVIQQHKIHAPLATVVLVKNQATNRVRIRKYRITKFYKKRMPDCYTYAGIAVISKKIFKYFPDDKKIFSLPEIFNLALEKGELLYPYITCDFWCDIGTPKVFKTLTGKLKNLVTKVSEPQQCQHGMP
ncbi:MAG: NDP-sugar synthase [candidate division WOR-3 bacterium]